MKEYQIVTAGKVEELNQKVSDLLKGGWHLHGDPVITSGDLGHGITNVLAQAVVK